MYLHALDCLPHNETLDCLLQSERVAVLRMKSHWDPFSHGDDQMQIHRTQSRLTMFNSLLSETVEICPTDYIN